jgi:hypothetical protein
MKRAVLCLLLPLAWSVCANCQAQILGWSRELVLNSFQRGQAISADRLGSVYIAGATAAPSANMDGFLAKYDDAGQLQWTRLIQNAVAGIEDQARGVSADGLGSVYVTGHHGGTNFLRKYSAAGDLAWSRTLAIPTFQTTTNAVSADALGNVFTVGYVLRPLDANSSEVNVVVAKYDATGALAWSHQLATPGYDEGNGVSADGLGNVYISGVTFGDLSGENAGDADAFVAKYNSAGALAWIRQLGSGSRDYSLGVTADLLGNVFMTGNTLGSLAGPSTHFADPFLAKYDAGGDLIWTRQFGSPETDISYGVSADGLGNAYLSGYTEGNLVGGPNDPWSDAFLMKFDTAGTLKFTRQYGTGPYDESRGVSADGQGNAYITGRLDGGDRVGGTSGGVAFVNKYQLPEPGSLVLSMSAVIGARLVRRRGRSRGHTTSG